MIGAFFASGITGKFCNKLTNINYVLFNCKTFRAVENFKIQNRSNEE